MNIRFNKVSIFKSILFISILLPVIVLINSSLDIYNNFAYDRAILKDSPYGYTPILERPGDYTSQKGEVLSGHYVYVVDWLSGYSKDIAYAKIKSKMNEGYVNKELLVQANINVMPVISVILLISGFIFFGKMYIGKKRDKNFKFRTLTGIDI